MRNSCRVAVICTVPVLVAFLALASSPASAVYVTEGWVLEEYTYTEGWGYVYDDRPWAVAYRGELGTSASAWGRYSISWLWQGNEEPQGRLMQFWQVDGTIGFFEDPTNPYYASTSGPLSGHGPPDYWTPNTVRTDFFGNSIILFVEVSADVTNFGHASGKADADLSSGGGAE